MNDEHFAELVKWSRGFILGSISSEEFNQAVLTVCERVMSQRMDLDARLLAGDTPEIMSKLMSVVKDMEWANALLRENKPREAGMVLGAALDGLYGWPGRQPPTATETAPGPSGRHVGVCRPILDTYLVDQASIELVSNTYEGVDRAATCPPVGAEPDAVRFQRLLDAGIDIINSHYLIDRRVVVQRPVLIQANVLVFIGDGEMWVPTDKLRGTSIISNHFLSKDVPRLGLDVGPDGWLIMARRRRRTQAAVEASIDVSGWKPISCG